MLLAAVVLSSIPDKHPALSEMLRILAGQKPQGVALVGAIIHLSVTLALITLAFCIRHTVLWRFRTTRLKEVDTVYDAFYLVHRHAEACPQCSSGSGARDNPREQLLNEALQQSLRQRASGRSVALECLESLMRERSAETPELSSLYFAGADEDHRFFLKNQNIAIGMAVLPQDEPKSSRCKRHPHQIETIFVLNGQLRLEREKAGALAVEVLQGGAVATIHKNQCHRITAIDKAQATYLFVKTNPAMEPRGEDCALPASSKTS